MNKDYPIKGVSETRNICFLEKILISKKKHAPDEIEKELRSSRRKYNEKN